MNSAPRKALRTQSGRALAALLQFSFAAAQESGTTAVSPELPQELSQTVAAAYKAGDAGSFQVAAKALETAVDAAPENVELRKKLGFLYLENLHQPEKALPHLEKVSGALPEDEGWMQLLARASKESHKFDRAAELYRRAAERNPSDLWARYHLGWTLLEGGHRAEAHAAFEQARIIEPGNHYVIEALAASAPVIKPVKAATPKAPIELAVEAAYTSGNPEQYRRAAALLEAALRQSPGDLANRKSVGFIYLEKLRDARAALPHLRAVVDALPRDSAWLQMLARAQEESGDLHAAASSWRDASLKNPRDVWARYHLGRVLAKLGSLESAHSTFVEALALDPRNQYVRMELARLANTAGHARAAAALTEQVLIAEPGNPDAHTLRGDIYRADWNFPRARAEYDAALATDPEFASARFGLTTIAKEKAPRATLAFYTFEDTEDYRQTGVFANVTVLMTGPVSVSVAANERWFRRSPWKTSDRFETAITVGYRASRALQVVGGVSQFKTEHHGERVGANLAVYVTPARAVDLWASFRYNDPVSDDFIPARDAFTQDVVAGGVTLRPTHLSSVSFVASNADYSDGNTRQFALTSLSYLVSEKFATTARLEYEWLDFAHHVASYSSPQDYALLRPAVEAAPRLTDWLRLQFRGELIYVYDEHAWGTGLNIGPRFNFSDNLEFGFTYLRYDIPGYQTNYSGEGFKIDLSYRF